MISEFANKVEFLSILYLKKWLLIQFVNNYLMIYKYCLTNYVLNNNEIINKQYEFANKIKDLAVARAVSKALLKHSIKQFPYNAH